VLARLCQPGLSMRAVSPLAFQTGGYKALLIWGLGTGVFPVFRPCERIAL
jgi:hypothetical protein